MFKILPKGYGLMLTKRKQKAGLTVAWHFRRQNTAFNWTVLLMYSIGTEYLHPLNVTSDSQVTFAMIKCYLGE